MDKEIKKMRDATIDLVDAHFPKGECKERGKAIVLYAELLIALSQYVLEARMESSSDDKKKGLE